MESLDHREAGTNVDKAELSVVITGIEPVPESKEQASERENIEAELETAVADAIESHPAIVDSQTIRSTHLPL